MLRLTLCEMFYRFEAGGGGLSTARMDASGETDRVLSSFVFG